MSEAVVPVGAWPNYVLGNHDESRVVSRFGVRQAREGLESGSQDCFVYLRQFDNQRLLVAINFLEEPQLVKIPELIERQMLLSTSLNREEHINLAALMLDGHEGRIIELPDGE